MDRMDKLPNNLQLTTYHLQLTWVVCASSRRVSPAILLKGSFPGLYFPQYIGSLSA